MRDPVRAVFVHSSNEDQFASLPEIEACLASNPQELVTLHEYIGGGVCMIHIGVDDMAELLFFGYIEIQIGNLVAIPMYS